MRTRSKKLLMQNLTAWAYLTPNFIGFIVFTLFAVVFSITLSLFSWDIFNPPRFVGFRNFIDLLGWNYASGKFEFNDPYFWKYLGNTLFFMLAIPVNMLLSLIIASLLNRGLKGSGFFRTVFYIPTICGGIALFMLWGFLYNPEFGLINRLLAFVGISGPAWLKDYYWAKPALMIITMWTSMGGTNSLLYLAGLQGIPESLYEAADIDGASPISKFIHITIPMLAPTSFFIFIMAVISGFQGGFDAAYILTQGGPAGSTTTLSYYIFNHAFVWYNIGYAAAISLVLFGIVLIVTLINWRFGGKNSEF